MATQVKVINSTAYTAMCTGPCLITPAENPLYAGANFPLLADKLKPEAFVSIGTSLPAVDTFLYHELSVLQDPRLTKGSMTYTGTETVYMRALNGQMVFKVTPIV